MKPSLLTFAAPLILRHRDAESPKNLFPAGTDPADWRDFWRMRLRHDGDGPKYVKGEVQHHVIEYF
jgi:hypothetical protein